MGDLVNAGRAFPQRLALLLALVSDGGSFERAFDEVFAVNVKGYLLGARAAAPHLQASGGNMVFTVSNAGFYPDGGGPIYTASKHAVVGVSEAMAIYLAPKGIGVTCVCPSGVITNILEQITVYGEPTSPRAPPTRSASTTAASTASPATGEVPKSRSA